MDSKKKREKMIKEIKSIYSGKIKSANPYAVTPNIASVNSTVKTAVKNNTFFNSVIDKLNIVVSDK